VVVCVGNVLEEQIEEVNILQTAFPYVDTASILGNYYRAVVRRNGS
jgi:hypothetical protein